MHTMPAAVYVGDRRIVVQQVAVPEPGPGEVLVEVSQCGICGTDLHLVLEGYARAGSVLGHEWSATVIATGRPPRSGRAATTSLTDARDVPAQDWEPGARVVWNPSPGCGACRACRKGRPSVCLRRETPDYLDSRGAFCQFLAVPAPNLLRVPERLSTRAAALTEPTAIALHAVNIAGVGADDRVLVTGAGPVGLLMIAVLASRGTRDITVSEPSEARRERALAVGASRAVLPESLPHAPMGRPIGEPFAVAFECSGHASAAERALDQLDRAGTLVFVGTGRESPRINHNRMIVLELEAKGAYNYDASGFGPAIELLASGALPLDLLIEPEDIPLTGLLSTMQRLAVGEIPGKVLVRPRGDNDG